MYYPQLVSSLLLVQFSVMAPKKQTASVNETKTEEVKESVDSEKQREKVLPKQESCDSFSERAEDVIGIQFGCGDVKNGVLTVNEVFDWAISFHVLFVNKIELLNFCHFN